MALSLWLHLLVAVRGNESCATGQQHVRAPLLAARHATGNMCRDSWLGQLPHRYRDWRERRISAKRKRRAADHKLQEFLREYRHFRKEELMREWRFQNYFEADFNFVLLVFDKVVEIVWPWLYLFFVPGQRYWLIPLLIPVLTMKGTIWGMLVDNCFLAWCAGMWLKSSPRILY